MHVTVDDFNFVAAENVYMLTTQGVHQQRVNCLINTCVFAS